MVDARYPTDSKQTLNSVQYDKCDRYLGGDALHVWPGYLKRLSCDLWSGPHSAWQKLVPRQDGLDLSGQQNHE